MKKSKWQKGVPPRNGIWEIKCSENGDIWYARFKDGKWADGYYVVERVPKWRGPYVENNDPKNPRKWRGILE